MLVLTTIRHVICRVYLDQCMSCSHGGTIVCRVNLGHYIHVYLDHHLRFSGPSFACLSGSSSVVFIWINVCRVYLDHHLRVYLDHRLLCLFGSTSVVFIWNIIRHIYLDLRQSHSSGSYSVGCRVHTDHRLSCSSGLSSDLSHSPSLTQSFRHPETDKARCSFGC